MTSSYSLKTWLSSEELQVVTERSDTKAILFFLFHLLIYSLCLIGALADYSWVGNAFFSLYLGVVIGQMFLIGHDACHQALAKSRMLNNIIGRFSFSFSLHSYSLWELLHHKHHHKYTNIKDWDYVWSPMTLEEYSACSKPRQWLEQIYRSWFGAGIYYFIEMWLKHAFVPVSSEARKSLTNHLHNSLIAVCLWALNCSFIYKIAEILEIQKGWAITFLVAIVIPFGVANWLMGFFVYAQHTSPTIPWFMKGGTLLNHQTRNINATPYIRYPLLFHLIAWNLTEHTAHHLQPNIPDYNLEKAQQALMKVHGDSIQSYRLTWKDYLKTTQVCKLYSFDKNCWTDFSGSPTSSRVETVNKG